MYPHHLHTNRCLPDEVLAKPHQAKQIIEVIMLKEELMFDINAELHQIENTRKPEESKLLTNEQMDNHLLARHIDAALNKVVERCQAYLLIPSPYVHRISNNHTHDWSEKSIFLAMPINWPLHCMDALRDACHDYIVQYAQALFLAKIAPDTAAISQNMAEHRYSEINALLSHRNGGVRIHPTFLG